PEVAGQAGVATGVAGGDEDGLAELGGLVVDRLLGVREGAPVSGLAAAQADADHGARAGIDQRTLEAEPGGAAAGLGVVEGERRARRDGMDDLQVHDSIALPLERAGATPYCGAGLAPLGPGDVGVEVGLVEAT